MKSDGTSRIADAKASIGSALHVGRPNVGDHDRFLTLASEILDRGWLTNDGPVVRELESRIVEALSVRHCVAMCNGTVALEIAIRALGLTGEVIVPSYTFIATAHALAWQGITPVFADIDPATHNLDPADVRRKISPRTSGIIGVHLWGRPADVVGLKSVADEHGLALMYDAAHAFSCSVKGSPVGSFGRCEVLSFHATKVFNTFEGGAVVTNDDELAETMRLMRNFGFAGYDNVIHPGTNGKMVEVCAAMGLCNLEALPRFIATNQDRYDAYSRAFRDIQGVRLIAYDLADTPNYHYVVAEVEGGEAVRDEIVRRLHGRNILARKYFWPGCHRMRPYLDSRHDWGRELPHTEAVASRTLVLPTGPSVEVQDISTIAAVLRECLGSA